MATAKELWVEGLSSPLKKVLKKQDFDGASPGPLLDNLQQLIDVIGSGLKTTSSYFALPQRVLHPINQSLHDPLPNDFKRPQLRSFPTIAGLFMLLRGSELAVGETKPKRVLLIDPERLDQWNAMNATERYMNLLSTLLFDASLSVTGYASRASVGLYSGIWTQYLRLEDKVCNHPFARQTSLDLDDAVVVSLLHEFGWLRVTYPKSIPAGKSPLPNRLERTDFGDAMFAAIYGGKTRYQEDSESLHSLLAKYFDDWKQQWPTQASEFRAGEHTLKVKFGKTWRRLVVPAEASMEDLALAILEAYEFDEDHLYQFTMRDRGGSLVGIVDPRCNEGEYFADEVRIGDLPLPMGEALEFEYDFGMSWRFQVELEAIGEQPSKLKEIAITEASGDPPKQYDDEDDYEDDEDDYDDE